MSGGERTGDAGTAIEPPVPERTGETRVGGGLRDPLISHTK